MNRPVPLALLALLVLLLALGLHQASQIHPRNAPPLPETHPTQPPSSLASARPGTARDPREGWRRSNPTSQAGLTDPLAHEGSPSRPDWLERLLRGESDPVSRESLDRWFASGHTNAADLLAARQAGGGQEFLEKALREFPNDPQVLLAAADQSANPEIRRERLDRLRAAAPQNPLADYLSAWNEFKAGNPEKALQHLTDASTKGGFKDYVLESMKAAEQLLLFDGRSPAEAIANGSSTALLGHLPRLKEVSKQLSELQSQAIAPGDSSAAEHYARLGIQMGEHLSQGPGSMTLIGELVGWVIEKNALKALPPGTSLDFLQGTPADAINQIEQRQQSSKAEFEVFQKQFETASETEVQTFYEHLHTYGERTAIQHWIEQTDPRPTP